MNNLMLYIHIPFCEKKCNYCDFVSFHANAETINKYISILISEIKEKSPIAKDYVVSSIYIGGGTPSFIEKEYITNIIKCIRNNYALCEEAEITIEANPNSINDEKLNTYLECGINRLSIGLQSTNDDELKTLGRVHNYNDFLRAYNSAIHIGFKNINIDLINGIPNQTPESFRRTLKQIMMLNIKHLSIYNLIIEDNTPFKTMLAENKITLPLETDLLKMDETTKELTTYYRLNRYEISNYAKAGYECRHNLGYWSDVPYLGFGLNAASYINKTRFKNKTKLIDYLNLNYEKYLLSTKPNIYYDEMSFVCEKDHINEYIMLGFRKTIGINIDEFYNKFNISFEDHFKSTIKYYQSLELLAKSNKNYYLTDKGLNISNKIICDFINY